MGNEKPIIKLNGFLGWNSEYKLNSGLKKDDLDDDEKKIYAVFDGKSKNIDGTVLDASETADFYNKLYKCDVDNDGELDSDELGRFLGSINLTNVSIDTLKTFIKKIGKANDDKGSIELNEDNEAIAKSKVKEDDIVPPEITIPYNDSGDSYKFKLNDNVRIEDIRTFIKNSKLSNDDKFNANGDLEKLAKKFNAVEDDVFNHDEIPGFLKTMSKIGAAMDAEGNITGISTVFTKDRLDTAAKYLGVAPASLRVFIQALSKIEGIDPTKPVENAKPVDDKQPVTGTPKTVDEALDLYKQNLGSGKQFVYTVPAGATINYVLNDILTQMGIPRDQIKDSHRQQLLEMLGKQNGGLKLGTGIKLNKDDGLLRPIRKNGEIVKGFWAGQEIKIAFNAKGTPLSQAQSGLHSGGKIGGGSGSSTSKTQSGGGSGKSPASTTEDLRPIQNGKKTSDSDVSDISTNNSHGVEDLRPIQNGKKTDNTSAITKPDKQGRTDNGGSENSGEVDKPSTTEEEYENKPFNKGHDAKGINFNNTGVLNPIDVFSIDKIKDANNGGYLVNQEKGLYAEVKKDKKEITLTFHETNSTSSPVTKKIVMKLSDKNDLKHPKEICEYDASDTLVAIQKRTYTGKGESAQLDSLVETAQSGPNAGQVTKEYKEIELEKGKKEKKFINYDYGTGTRIMNIFGSEKESNLTGKDAILACEKTIIETTSGDKRTTERTIIERNKNGETANIKYTKHFENGLLEKRNNVYCEFKDVKMDPKTGNPIEKGEYYDAKTMTSVKISDKLFRKAEYANGELVITKYNNSDVSINDENPLSSKINGNAIFTFRKKEINGKLQPIRKIDKTDKKAEKTTVWFYDNSGNLLGNAERTVNNDNGKTTANILWTVGEKSGMIHEKGQDDEVKQMLDKLGLTEDTAFNEGNTKANK